QALETLTRLERDYQSVLREIELAEQESVSTIFAFSTTIPIERLQSALRLDETLIEFYSVNGVICAFILQSDGMQVIDDVSGLREVALAARRMRYYLQKSGSVLDYAARHARSLQEDVQETLRQLYDLLLRPLEKHLTTEKIVLVPHGILHG